MEVFEGKVRRVGTSLGFLIPKEVVSHDKIKEDEQIKVAILKKDTSLIDKMFGSVKTKPFRRNHKDRVF